MIGSQKKNRNGIEYKISLVLPQVKFSCLNVSFRKVTVTQMKHNVAQYIFQATIPRGRIHYQWQTYCNIL
jgi:hypothetical protein